jgi:hypothetical protein
VSTARDVLTGFGDLLVAAGVAVQSSTAPFQPSDTALVFGNRPAQPDRLVELTFVPMTDNPSMPTGVVMVHAICRGLPNNPLDTDDLSDAVFNTVHGLTDVMFGACHVVQILRHASIDVGQDDSARHERSDQFFINLDFAPTVLRPEGGSW